MTVGLTKEPASTHGLDVAQTPAAGRVRLVPTTFEYLREADMSVVNLGEPDGEQAIRAIAPTLESARAKFIELVETIRPDLFRYCARMAGSVADGEDLVQETLAKAYYELIEFREPMALRPWLFRIAHNLSIDRYRRSQIRAMEPLEAADETPASEEHQPETAVARKQTIGLAMRAFLSLPPVQRACVILKDVLDFTLEEIAEQLDTSVVAVKSALHRGRSAIAKLDSEALLAHSTRTHSPVLLKYAQLFNAHDWDGVRALLADDVRLDVVMKLKASGKPRVGRYFSNYERLSGWYMEPAWLDGREILAVYEHSGANQPIYFIDVEVVGDQVSFIHDFRYVPYVLRETNVELIRSSRP